MKELGGNSGSDATRGRLSEVKRRPALEVSKRASMPFGTSPREGKTIIETSETQIVRTENGPTVLFPKNLTRSEGVLGYLVQAYNDNVGELRDEGSQGFPYIGITLTNRINDSHYERRRPDEIPSDEIDTYNAEMKRVACSFSELSTSQPIISEQGGRTTYQQIPMGYYPVLSDEGEMVHRPVIVVPSVNGKPGGLATTYTLDVYMRDPNAEGIPNIDSDRLICAMSLESFPHPSLVPTYSYVRGFGNLLDQTIKLNKGGVIQGEVKENNE